MSWQNVKTRNYKILYLSFESCLRKFENFFPALDKTFRRCGTVLPVTTTASPKTLTDVLTSQQIDRLAFGLEEARELALSEPIDQLSSEVANSLGGVTGLQVVVKPGWVRGLIEDGKLYCSENRNRYEALGTILRVFYWWFGGDVKISQVEVLLSAYDQVHKTKFVKNFQEVCA